MNTLEGFRQCGAGGLCPVTLIYYYYESESVSQSVVSNSWTVACQAPLSKGFSRQEYRSGFPSLPPGDFPGPGIKPKSPASPTLAGGFFTTGATWQAPYLSYQGYIEVETGLYGEQLLLLVIAAATH